MNEDLAINSCDISKEFGGQEKPYYRKNELETQPNDEDEYSLTEKEPPTTNENPSQVTTAILDVVGSKQNDDPTTENYDVPEKCPSKVASEQIPDATESIESSKNDLENKEQSDVPTSQATPETQFVSGDQQQVPTSLLMIPEKREIFEQRQAEGEKTTNQPETCSLPIEAHLVKTENEDVSNKQSDPKQIESDETKQQNSHPTEQPNCPKVVAHIEKTHPEITSESSTNTQNVHQQHAPSPPIPQSQQSLQQLEHHHQQHQQQPQSRTDEANVRMYKTIAIKMKKELVKTKEELTTLIANSDKEIRTLKDRIKDLEEADKLSQGLLASSEDYVQDLQNKLEESETNLRSLKMKFDQYKQKATELLKENKPNSLLLEVNPLKSLEEEKYKQLKEFNDEQKKRIIRLEDQLAKIISLNEDLEKKNAKSNEITQLLSIKNKQILELEEKIVTLGSENDSLKQTLVQFRRRLREPLEGERNDDSGGQSIIKSLPHKSKSVQDQLNKSDITRTSKASVPNVGSASSLSNQLTVIETNNLDSRSQLSQQMSITTNEQQRLHINQDSRDNNSSNSSNESGSSGYVHIKANASEIINRYTINDDVQSQLESLAKAYMDSESTNALLSDQVSALKDEIRRMQRSAERIELAQNLEYLKNVLFKFLSLDANQDEQRQRLVPVLSTILKLSPEETSKLNSVTVTDKRHSLANSFFKL